MNHIFKFLIHPVSTSEKLTSPVLTGMGCKAVPRRGLLITDASIVESSGLLHPSV